MFFWDQSDLFNWFVEFSNQRYLFFTTIRKGKATSRVSCSSWWEKKKKPSRRGEEKKQCKIPYIWMYEMWNASVKTQNSHLSKHACIIIVCGCTEILQLNTQHTCCKKKEFENETYMNLGTPRKAYEFQCFFVRECRLFSCNLEYHEALLAKNRSL